MHKHHKSPWRLRVGLPAAHSIIEPAFTLPLYFLLSAAVFIGACASPNKQPEINYHQVSSEISRLNEQIMTQADMNSDPGDYLLGPGDLVRISVFEAEELEV